MLKASKEHWLSHLAIQESILQDGRSTFLVFQALYLGVCAVFITVLFQLSPHDGNFAFKNLFLVFAQTIMLALISRTICSGMSNLDFNSNRIVKRGNIVRMLQQIAARVEANLLESDLAAFEDPTLSQLTPTELVKIAERPDHLLNYVNTNTTIPESRKIFEKYSPLTLRYVGWIATGNGGFYCNELVELLSKYVMIGTYENISAPANRQRAVHGTPFDTLWIIMIALMVVGFLYWMSGIIATMGFSSNLTGS